jgi:hypothetical protein
MINNSTNINNTNKIEWRSLESRRTNSRLIMMLKMTKNLTSVDTSDKLIPLQRPSINCNPLACTIPSCRQSIRNESFYPRTTKYWNALNDASVGAPSLEAFKACLVSKLPVPFFNLTVDIPHTNFVVLTCAHPKWQNIQSDDGGRSVEEEEERAPTLTEHIQTISRNMSLEIQDLD